MFCYGKYNNVVENNETKRSVSLAAWIHRSKLRATAMWLVLMGEMLSYLFPQDFESLSPMVYQEGDS